MEVLPSCGCGDPESIAKYVMDMFLKHVKQDDTDDTECWDKTEYEDLPVMFFLSWADDKGYTDHRTTIRCSWMSSEGNELLNDLITIFKESESNG